MHVFAAKAVAFKEALSPDFKVHAAQVASNARVLADTLVKRGLRIVSGRTESHVMLVDLRAKGITGKLAEAVLGEAHITVNKNAIPNDPEKPFVTSGIRLGRSEERRVGKECVSTCRSRWTAYHKNKNKTLEHDNTT